MNSGIANISEKYKFFIWLPPKTGTTHASFIFKHFDIQSKFFKKNGEIEVVEFRHNHSLNFFPGSEKYKFILTARNPFTRYVSLFKFSSKKKSEELTVENFRKFFFDMVDSNDMKNYFLSHSLRLPDYSLRIEHLWTDYTNIPFIRNSKLYQSGILYDLCNKKFNSTPKLKDEELFYSQDMKDYLMTIGKKYFEFYGYDYPYS